MPEDRPHKHVKYLAVALYYWGRGDTQQEAVKQLREAGFRGRVGPKKRVLLYEFPEGCEDPHVNDMGTVCWYAAPGLEEAPDPSRGWLQPDGSVKPYA